MDTFWVAVVAQVTIFATHWVAINSRVTALEARSDLVKDDLAVIKEDIKSLLSGAGNGK